MHCASDVLEKATSASKASDTDNTDLMTKDRSPAPNVVSMARSFLHVAPSCRGPPNKGKTRDWGKSERGRSGKKDGKDGEASANGRALRPGRSGPAAQGGPDVAIEGDVGDHRLPILGWCHGLELGQELTGLLEVGSIARYLPEQETGFQLALVGESPLMGPEGCNCDLRLSTVQQRQGNRCPDNL